jgi:hypothetical protein
MPTTTAVPAALSVAPGQISPPGAVDREHLPDGRLRESR